MFVKISEQKNLRAPRKFSADNLRPNKYNFRENSRTKNIFVRTFGNFVRYEDHSIPNFKNTEYSCSYEELSMSPLATRLQPLLSLQVNGTMMEQNNKINFENTLMVTRH